MNKKGDLTSTQLVTIILVIVGFVLLIFALYSVFNNQELTDRETCRLSILSRATVPSVAAQAVPLSCFTEKICITIDKIGGKNNDCKQFAGEENVRKVGVKIDKNDAINQKSVEIIQREVANAMFDCWVMTGQGKMDIFTKEYSLDKDVPGKLIQETTDVIDLTVSQINPQCIVCSRVAFSDALIEADKEVVNGVNKSKFLKNIDYNSFMSREKVPGSSLTYLQAFTDESVGSGYGSIGGSESLSKYFGKTSFVQSDIDDIRRILELQFRGQSKELEELKNLFDGEINGVNEKLVKYFRGLSKPLASNQIAIVFTQIKVPSDVPKEQFWNTFSNGAILGGVAAISGPGKIFSFFIPGPGWLKALYKIGTIGAVSFDLALTAEDATRDNQALSVATCGDFQSTANGQKGCSLVKLVNWDVETINNLCAKIEGNL